MVTIHDRAKMERPGGRRISGSTFFLKFVFPAVHLGFSLCWIIGVSFFSMGKDKPPSLGAGCIGLFIFFGGLYYFSVYHFPLKRVWMSLDGLRISNFRAEIAIPFTAIESIRQMTQLNLRYVVVDLREEMILGRRFTFVPESPKPPWPFTSGEDAVVIDLRELIKTARGVVSGKPPREPAGRSGRSTMADDELDGLI